MKGPRTIEAARRTDSQMPVEAQAQTTRKRLGQNARELRRRLGLSQQAVALRTGMDRGVVGDFERGHRDFSLSTLLRVAASLEVDVSELFSGAADWYFRPLPAPMYAPGDPQPSKAERDEALKRLWAEEKTEREIAEALDMAPGAVASSVADLRDAGVSLQYRRPPLDARQAGVRDRRQSPFVESQSFFFARQPDSDRGSRPQQLD